MPSRGFPSARPRRYAAATAFFGGPPRSASPLRTLTIVGDASSHSLTTLQRGLAVVPRRVSWSSATAIDAPGRAIVAFLEPGDEPRLETLHAWTRRAWQPLAVISLTADHTDAVLRGPFEEWGFRVITGTESPDWIRLRRSLEAVLSANAWLAPLAADALRTNDPAVVTALDACLRLLPHRHTVQSWSRALGYGHRQALHALFAERRLPSPKIVLDHLRLACLAEHAHSTWPCPDRTDLARRFGYSSADYLGKAVKRCLGCSVGELVAAGPGRALDALHCITRSLP